jgi:hypothetical protein
MHAPPAALFAVEFLLSAPSRLRLHAPDTCCCERPQPSLHLAGSCRSPDSLLSTHIASLALHVCSRSKRDALSCCDLPVSCVLVPVRESAQHIHAWQQALWSLHYKEGERNA